MFKFTDTKMSPACVSVVGSGQVTPEKPTLNVRVCDILSQPLVLAVDSVIAQSATRLADDVVVLSKQKLVATSDPTVYALNLKHDPGRYRIALTAGKYLISHIECSMELSKKVTILFTCLQPDKNIKTYT